MRRSVPAAIGLAAVLVVAACSPDSAIREPLAPTTPSLASATLCSGSLASEIVKKHKLLFAQSDGLPALEATFKLVKSGCPNASEKMMEYLQLVVTYGAPAPTAARADDLIALWAMVIKFHDDEIFTRPAGVLLSDGGAAVVAPDGNMTTFDGKAGVKVADGTTVNGESTETGTHLFTFEKVTECPETNLRPTGRCYHLEVYPPDSDWSPKVTVGLCPAEHGMGPAGVSHEDDSFGTELLPPGDAWPPHCHLVASAMDGWLGRRAGPLGRAFARTYDYLTPRPLYAVDAGESGLLGDFSLIGGVLPTFFDDNFDDEPLGAFPDGRAPTVGEPWDVVVEHPGFVQVQNGLGDLTGNVIVISQALGNCLACPPVSLLGTVLNSTTESLGSFAIEWSSLQNKPSVKAAPFVVRSATGAELARLAYVTESSANLLKFNDATVGSWTRNVAQHFRITVNLNTSSEIGNPHKVFLSIKNAQGVYQQVAGPVDFITLGESTLGVFGYFLQGIDAGVIAADNIIVRRLPDSLP